MHSGHHEQHHHHHVPRQQQQARPGQQWSPHFHRHRVGLAPVTLPALCVVALITLVVMIIASAHGWLN